MSNPLQVVIPAALGLLVAYQGLLTRTGRLRSTIRANLELLDTLPADHPSRATLTAHIGELVDTLVRRQRRWFEPMSAGPSFGVYVTITVIALLGIAIMGAEGTGVYEPEPQSRGDLWTATTFYAALAVCFAGFALRAWRRQHPK